MQPGRWLRHTFDNRSSESNSGAGEFQHLHASIRFAGMASNQTSRLKTIDESRHIRRIARQSFSQFAHWNGPARFHQMQHVALRRR